MASIRIDANTRLVDCPEVAVNNRMPAPLSERLDQLVAVANTEGTATTRKEVLAALLLAAPEEGAELMDQVVAYRRALASAAAVQGHDPGDVLEFKSHPRGPRPRASTGGQAS